ncbi:imidazole glycerol phosphate synthase subunit HisH [Denitratimonas sp. CY0512]|uniref:imidazole glycerol phosphate synthase subunit HisH n=1 Tax=Denitratimonas sp. CY0512 TaxID=3131940 RepID=UPI003099DE7B
MMRVAVIDAGGANIGSVRYALDRLGVASVLTADADVIVASERVILPGVGAAKVAMARLRELDLIETIRSLQQPLLGICLGMQLLFDSSEEGEVETLGLLAGRVTKLPEATGIRIPHMGWNQLAIRRESPLLAGIESGAACYFVHSYAAPVTQDCIASSAHGLPFAAVVQRGNVAGAQFHPERSGAVGARLLQNFIRNPSP